jgi:DNA-directed RNA polymerase specialized sigma24 family protein
VTDGLTVEQIAAELGCRPGTVERALYDAGIAPRHRARPPSAETAPASTRGDGDRM